MSVDDVVVPGGRKSEILAMRDLAMMATAGKYDLTDATEKRRSVEDLSRLFLHLSSIMEIDLFVEAGAKDACVARRARRRLDPRARGRLRGEPVHVREVREGQHRQERRVPAHGADRRARHGEAPRATPTTGTGRAAADGQASLLRREEDGAAGFVEVDVEATTLDTFFARHPFERAALWVDVEGANDVVLQGGQTTIEKAAVVMIEVEDRAYWAGQRWLRPDVLSHLYDRGLVPVARDFQSRYQYNIVLVRADLLDTIDRVRWAITLFNSSSSARRRPDGPVADHRARAAPAGRTRASPPQQDPIPPRLRSEQWPINRPAGKSARAPCGAGSSSRTSPKPSPS